MVENDFRIAGGAVVVHQFVEASDQARLSAPGWHAEFEDLGIDPDPADCLRLAASSPSQLLSGFLFSQATAAGVMA